MPKDREGLLHARVAEIVNRWGADLLSTARAVADLELELARYRAELAREEAGRGRA